MKHAGHKNAQDRVVPQGTPPDDMTAHWTATPPLRRIRTDHPAGRVMRPTRANETTHPGNRTPPFNELPKHGGTR